MKELDARDRRLRFSPPNPKVKRIVLGDADYSLFEAIDRHGLLPIHYLYELTKGARKNYGNLQYRLTEMYNGDEAGPFLIRPAAQFNSYEARYQHITYGLAPRAVAVLAARKTIGKYPLKRTTDFVHDLMGACLAVSIELAAKERGLTYITREKILSKLGKPLPIEVPGGTLIPDDLFGIKGTDDKGDWYRYFAVEIDRNTESVRTKTPGVAGKFGKKVEGYYDIMRTRRHMEQWGISNLTVLTATTNVQHGQTILGFVAEAVSDPRYAAKFPVATETCFGTRVSQDADDFWRMPKGLLPLAQEPWLTVAGPKDIYRP